MGQCVMTIRAYARKAELGGGFRGLVLDRRDGSQIESDVLQTYEEARNWAIRESHARMGQTPYRRCSVNAGTAGRAYRANIWAY